MESKILLYKNSSGTGRLIAEKCELEFNGAFTGTYKCVNWGSSVDRKVRKKPVKWLNTREAVTLASDKLKAFHKFVEKGVVCPEFTDDRSVAEGWTGNIFCRTLTRANQGRGIIISRGTNSVANAPLYTKGVQSDREYRVHVFKDSVIGVARKVEIELDGVNEVDNADRLLIRNHVNGWKFSKCQVNQVNTQTLRAGLDAVKALGLDFGAVDVLYNSSTQVATVLEVNTAPGLEPNSTILEAYVTNIKEWLEEDEEEDVIIPFKNFKLKLIGSQVNEMVTLIENLFGNDVVISEGDEND